MILTDFDPDHGNTHVNTCSYLSDLFCALSNPTIIRGLKGSSIEYWSGIYFFFSKRLVVMTRSIIDIVSFFCIYPLTVSIFNYCYYYY